MELTGTLTVIGTGVAVIGLVYQIMRNFKQDVNRMFERYDHKLDLMEKRFETIDQRLFLLCMGKSLPDILKSERDKK
jgi:hypothetical protein